MPFGWSPPWRRGDGPERVEARKHLRTETLLDCDVELQDGHVIPAKVLDLTIQGACVRIVAEKSPRIEAEQTVRVKIHGPKRSWLVSSRAQVRNVEHEQGKWTHVGLAFVDLGYLYSQLENALSTWFNRRSRRRVSTEHEQGFAARLKLGRAIETARVHDLSIGGMAVLLSSFQAGPFTIGSTLDLRFTIPGTKKELTGTATVRHRAREGGIDRLGLEFDVGAHGFAQHVPSIERYLERLQQRVTRALRTRGA